MFEANQQAFERWAATFENATVNELGRAAVVALANQLDSVTLLFGNHLGCVTSDDCDARGYSVERFNGRYFGKNATFAVMRERVKIEGQAYPVYVATKAGAPGSGCVIWHRVHTFVLGAAPGPLTDGNGGFKGIRPPTNLADAVTAANAAGSRFGAKMSAAVDLDWYRANCAASAGRQTPVRGYGSNPVLRAGKTYSPEAHFFREQLAPRPYPKDSDEWPAWYRAYAHIDALSPVRLPSVPDADNAPVWVRRVIQGALRGLENDIAALPRVGPFLAPQIRDDELLPVGQPEIDRLVAASGEKQRLAA